MTLTKQDLSAITGIVQTETRKIVQTETRKIVREELTPMDKKISSLDRKVDRNFAFLKKRFDELFNFLDKSYIKVKTEVREIQTHLHLPTTDY